MPEEEQLTRRLANLPLGEAQILDALLQTPEELSIQDGAHRAQDARTYLVNRDALLPPLGYQKGEGEFPLIEQRTGIKVCRQLDFSTPGKLAADLWCYCSEEALSSLLAERTVERVGNLFIDSIQPALLAQKSEADEGKASEACIYCTSCEPMLFKDKEAIAASLLRFHVADHRKQEEEERGAEKGAREQQCGLPFPVQVAIPLRVNVVHLRQVQEEGVSGDPCDVWAFCPEKAAEGRRPHFDSLTMLAMRSIAQGDGRRMLKMLLDGSVRCDYRLTKDEVGAHFEGINWLSLLAIHRDDLQLFKALEICGAKVDEIQTLGHAAEWGRVELVQLLAPRSNTHEKDFALKVAARFGHAKVVEVLLEHGASNVEGAWRTAEDQRIIAEREMSECEKRGIDVTLDNLSNVALLFAQYADDPRLTAQQRGVFLQKAAGDFSLAGLGRVRQELAKRLGKDPEEEARVEREGREAAHQEKLRKQAELSQGLPPGWRVLIGLNGRPFYYFPGDQSVKSGYERPT